MGRHLPSKIIQKYRVSTTVYHKILQNKVISEEKSNAKTGKKKVVVALGWATVHLRG